VTFDYHKSFGFDFDFKSNNSSGKILNLTWVKYPSLQHTITETDNKICYNFSLRKKGVLTIARATTARRQLHAVTTARTDNYTEGNWSHVNCSCINEQQKWPSRVYNHLFNVYVMNVCTGSWTVFIALLLC